VSAFGYTLGYDANGNLTSRTKTGGSWSFRYAGFDKPRWMAKTVGSTTVGSEFLYDANRSRTVQLEFIGLAGGVPSGYVRKRVYGLGSTLEANYEKAASAPDTTWALKKVRIYVPGPDGIIGSREFDPAAPIGSQEKAFIYHYDHLGSIESITPFVPPGSGLAADSTGKPGRFSEDAWGQRRNPLTWSGAPTTTDDGGADSLTPRGFTGHEMLDDLGLINTGGRPYDALLGRFLSADLLVQKPGDLQSYNRYSYTRNNPLTFVDPSGWADDSPDGGFLDAAVGYMKALFVPDTAALPGRTDTSETRDFNQDSFRESARAGFDKGMQVLEVSAKTVDTANSLIPGVQLGKDLGELATGQNLVGQEVSRSDAGTRLAVGAALGTAVEVGAKPLTELTSKVVSTVAKAVGKEGDAVARIEVAAAKTGLKDEVKEAPANTDIGRSGRQERLRELGNDPDVSSADRGWIKNEERHIETGNRDTIRNPPGRDLAHERGREAAKGYSYEHSNLQDRDLHRTQHKYDNQGRANKERPVKKKKEDEN
jgi:RHS repeat-associated protein